MRRRLVNRSEQLTYDALLRVCEPHGARVFTKVRVADVFVLETRKVPPEHLSYGLRSHFDFVVTDNDYHPLFSVEFDGPLHRSSEIQRRRDRLKNDLCATFSHGLLRINSNYLTRQFRGLDLLTYFVDCWFLHEAFEAAQQAGSVPLDEVFDAAMIMSDGTQGKRWPYWLSLDVQLSLHDLHRKRLIRQPVPCCHIGRDPDANYRCLSWIRVGESDVLAVKTGMRLQNFRGVWSADLLQMLAAFDLHTRLQQVLAGSSEHLTNAGDFFSQALPRFEARFGLADAFYCGPSDPQHASGE